MSEKMLGADALAKVAGPLKDFSDKIGGPDGPIWWSAFKRFLRKENPWGGFLTWKIITLGTGISTIDDFRKALEREGVHIGHWSDIPGKPAFTVSPKEMEIELVRVTVAELCFENGAVLDGIYKRALKLGLKLCPPEVGPQLRLQYKCQPKGESLLIGMEPIGMDVTLSSCGGINVFYIGHNDVGLYLSSKNCNSVIVWPPSDRWVFVRRK